MNRHVIGQAAWPALDPTTAVCRRRPTRGKAVHPSKDFGREPRLASRGMDIGPADPELAVSLPADRCFVLQLRAGSDADREGSWSGRVEHVVTGRATRFEDCAGLREFVQRALCDADDPGGPPQ